MTCDDRPARTQHLTRLALGAGLLLALAACQGEKKDSAGKTAGGEILPRSVTDDMLPYDTVRSQPPLAPKAGPDGKGARAGSAGDETEADKTASSQRDEQTAPTAAPEPVRPAAE